MRAVASRASNCHRSNRGQPHRSHLKDDRRQPAGVRGIIRFALPWAIIAVSAPALGRCGVAWANDASNSQSSAMSSLPDLLKQMTDPGGLRTRLERAGVQFTFTYYGDLLGNPSGGVKQGPGYDGRFGTIIDADLEKLAGWSGAKVHASFHQIHGSEFSAN